MCSTPRVGDCAVMSWVLEWRAWVIRKQNGWGVPRAALGKLEQYIRHPPVVEPQQQRPDEREQQQRVSSCRLLAAGATNGVRGHAFRGGQNLTGRIRAPWDRAVLRNHRMIRRAAQRSLSRGGGQIKPRFSTASRAPTRLESRAGPGCICRGGFSIVGLAQCRPRPVA